MSKPAGSGGAGLLSKVVKFVKSPTTHWSDLDRPTSGDSGSESRLMLKEMIERKRRNDFVRNREFDMLRKARRRETPPNGDVAAEGASLFSSSDLTQSGERAHTLRKINEIEAQMAIAWSRRRASTLISPEGPPAPVAAPAPGGHPPAAKLPPSAQAPRAAAQPAMAPPKAFAPTLTMDQVVLAPAPRPLAAAVAGAGGAQTAVGSAVAGPRDPALEEAAIRFSNGDAAGAEAVLRALVADGGGRGGDLATWLTLFDLYRCTGDEAAFDAAAADFAARFGRSAPQWALMGGSFLAEARQAPATARTGLFDWVCPSALGTQSVTALAAALARHGSPWRVDWRHVKTIAPAALPPFTALLRYWSHTPGHFDFLGADRLLGLLAENSPTHAPDTDPLWWQARLALLRVLGEMEAFDSVALNFCVTYEVSPPAWEAPKNSVRALADESQVAADSGPAPCGPSGGLPAFAGADGAAPRVLTGGVFAATLTGELIGSADAVVRDLAAQADARVFELDCRHLVRVDFSAAGDLLNWAVDQQARGHPVTFLQVNRLVATLFDVIGISDAARVTPRAD